MKSIRRRTQGGVTIALEFPERVVQASTAELFSALHAGVNDSSHLPEDPGLAEFLAWLIDNGSWQAPHLDHSLANENHLCDFSNSGDPAIADRLRIKSRQSFRFLNLGLQQCSTPSGSVSLHLADCIHAGDEVVSLGK
jgi:hypothetical protein